VSLNPKITPPDARGYQYLEWTPDPTADGYKFTTPTGESRTFNPLLSKTRLGRNLVQPIVVTIAVLDVTARPAEQAVYPTTTPTMPLPLGDPNA
jgi:hypothetical protein